MIRLPALFLCGFLLQSAPPPAETDVTGRAREVISSLTAGNFAGVEALFTSDMARAMPPGTLAARWSVLLFQGGPFKRCAADVRVRSIGGKRMAITLCEFERKRFDIQFAFDASGKISGFVFRPAGDVASAFALPSYADPSGYVEEETTIGSTDPLPATLTIPAGTARVPALVLVHGSGPQDRDETIGANKPFRDLATGLASRGIAVLRYDKRSFERTANAPAAEFTVRQTVIDDAVAAVAMLRAHPRIDAPRIFVLGHSLGGTLVPRIAEADRAIAGFIVMAGAARPIPDVIVAQMRYLAQADGAVSQEEQQAIDNAAAAVNAIRSLRPEDARSGRMIFGVPASYWLDLRGYDPPSAARQVDAPMLVLQGERDYQVTMDEFALWKAALRARQDVSFRSYPALNHLFIAGTGPSLPAEYQVPGHVAEDVVRDIAVWILARR